MRRFLQTLEKNGTALRVALVGAGSMGLGVALQIRETPGLSLVAVADTEVSKAEAAAALYRQRPFARNPHKPWCPSGPTVLKDIIPFLQSSTCTVDVLVEATNTVSYASRASIIALENKINVVSEPGFGAFVFSSVRTGRGHTGRS